MVIANENELIGRNGFGIPRAELQKHGERIITGGSGLTLHLIVHPQEILISASDGLGLHAFLYDYNTIGLSLHTKGYENDPKRRHPDLFAKEFIGEAIACLCKYNAHIRRVKGVWQKYNLQESDNARQFLALLPELEKTMSQKEAEEEAAKRTWTGGVVRALGYTRVEHVSIGENRIIADFVMPSKK